MEGGEEEDGSSVKDKTAEESKVAPGSPKATNNATVLSSPTKEDKIPTESNDDKEAHEFRVETHGDEVEEAAQERKVAVTVPKFIVFDFIDEYKEALRNSSDIVFPVLIEQE